MIIYSYVVLLKVASNSFESMKFLLGIKTAIILPDSGMDNDHKRELDCNDIGSESKYKHRYMNRELLKSNS